LQVGIGKSGLGSTWVVGDVSAGITANKSAFAREPESGDGAFHANARQRAHIHQSKDREGSIHRPRCLFPVVMGRSLLVPSASRVRRGDSSVSLTHRIAEGESDLSHGPAGGLPAESARIAACRLGSLSAVSDGITCARARASNLSLTCREC